MRIKIALLIIILLILWGISVALKLPFVLHNPIYGYISEYIPFITKGISLLSIVVGAYAISLVLNFVLTKASVTIIRGNALAKKVFPLIHWGISLAVWIIAGFFILGALGINIAALVTGAWIGGVLFALASKEFIANLFGSLSLILSKNFKIGDVIKVKGYEGTVDEISLSYTRLIDKKWVVIFMPNKLIISETIENMSMAENKKADMSCEIKAKDTKDLTKIIEWIEKEIVKLGDKNTKASSSIDAITENGYTVTFHIETTGDMASIKKDAWLILGETTKK